MLLLFCHGKHERPAAHAVQALARDLAPIDFMPHSLVAAGEYTPLHARDILVKDIDELKVRHCCCAALALMHWGKLVSWTLQMSGASGTDDSHAPHAHRKQCPICRSLFGK